MDINELLRGVDCSCGRHHACDIGCVWVEKGAVSHLEELCRDYKSIMLVADENTYGVAGESVEKYAKISRSVIFSGKTVLIPNEEAINRVTDSLGDTDLIIGIGSGVIQDLCKYVSFNSKIPYYIVATAPSMDGYASTGAAMITGGMKVTYSAKVPEAIIADTDFLTTAPLEMIKAGYGDIIGKYSALCDWDIGHVVNGEYLCPEIYKLTMDTVERVLPLAEKLLERDAESVRTLMEALVLVGIAMSFAGNSRPASGSEHHLSHFFEITGIIDGEKYLPHGIDVVYSTYVTSLIREKLLKKEFPKVKFVEEGREEEIRRVYKSVADGCIALQNKLGTYETDRIPAYLEHEKEIKEIFSRVPSAEEIKTIIGRIGLDMNEFYSTYSKDKLRDAIRYAKDLKDRYTVLWMWYDMFGLEEIL
ncbi:MAG: sn-glycerol-1-phosphate dehydrogenase [Clostridia bacterium]|nr:sn-glycerol-1-phosphate dehydrogenase [Clostridia bacterium]